MTTGVQPPQEVTRTWKPTTAGILTVIAGALNIIVGLLLAAAIDFGAFIANIPGIFPVGLGGLIGGALIIPGIISLIGGIFALRRRVWGMALAGAILALFPPPLLPFGILSIIFVSMGRREFH